MKMDQKQENYTKCSTVFKKIFCKSIQNRFVKIDSDIQKRI